ncbi:ependymin-related protein 1-like [Haliotis rubra]|uniref:ependymin-related protein 1-like n=1 Tax=Haliotis rubra TaxID=36100 RepID=UPI001EE5EC0D|nr:ependymin-related protein 1-like [Haliotis rubra]
MMLQAVLLASLAIVAHGTICCAPQQWEAFKDYTIVDSSGGERGLQYYSYDALNKRYAISGNYTAFVSSYKEIWDYRQGTGFRIDSDKQTCETFSVSGSFPANCIPGGAVEMGPLFYGFGTDSLSAIAYQFNDTRNEFKNTVAVVSRRDCVPIISTTTILRPGNNYLYALGYNNIFPGIRDVTVFDPPSFCRKSVMKEVNSLYKSLRV